MSTLVGFRILDFRAWKAEEGKAGERENFCLTISQAERGGRRKGATFLPLPPPPFRSRSQRELRKKKEEAGKKVMPSSAPRAGEELRDRGGLYLLRAGGQE